jgi:hypothetical protein
LPSQSAHRAALPDPRLSEQLGIAVSYWVLLSLFVDHPFSASRFIGLCAFPTHTAKNDHDQRLN